MDDTEQRCPGIENGSEWSIKKKISIGPVQPRKVVNLERWIDLFETFPVGPNRYIQFQKEISGNFG